MIGGTGRAPAMPFEVRQDSNRTGWQQVRLFNVAHCQYSTVLLT
jgi:hypothetical protein